VPRATSLSSLDRERWKTVRALSAWILSVGVCCWSCASEPVSKLQGIFFDDFNYDDAAALASGGWIVRQQPGHPGIAGARWGADSLSIVRDPDEPGNRLLRLEAKTDGTVNGTRQAQVCHARKYLEGTYAARLRFYDSPDFGPAGDVVVQSFYMVSPLRFDFDPEFSEVDWEYLPNGGWGDARARLYGISWQAVRIEPWKAYNHAHEEIGHFGGWHTLVIQVGGGTTRHYLDGRLLAEHGGRNYPVTAMSINFNLWFSPGGELPLEHSERIYQLDVDWVFHARNVLLSPTDVLKSVQDLRSDGRSRTDSVPEFAPLLASSCNI